MAQQKGHLGFAWKLTYFSNNSRYPVFILYNISTVCSCLNPTCSSRHALVTAAPGCNSSGAVLCETDLCLSVSQVDASQQGTGDNHAISALKFKVLQEFLELNWHVLLSDVDIVTLQVLYSATG